MNVKRFLMQFNDIDKLYNRYIELYPIFADYEEAAYSPEKLAAAKKKHYELFLLFINRIKATETSDNNEVLFVTKEIGMFFGDENGFNSWTCKKEDIYKKVPKGMVSLWNGEEDRIEHYGYDMSPLNEVLSMEAFLYEVDVLDAACEIIENLTFFGMEEDNRMERVEDIIDSLEQQVEEIKNGTIKTIPAEDIFRELEEEILNSASEEEKIEILKDKEERKKNKNRDDVYSAVALSINHMLCVQAVLEYYRLEILNGNVKL